jgi:hypothetical protein
MQPESDISKKSIQHNGQKKRYKRTNNDLQNIHIKLKIENNLCEKAHIFVQNNKTGFSFHGYLLS